MNHDSSYIKKYQFTHKEINKKIAIHQAGHAAAVYIGNKQKLLPEVFFEISIKTLHCRARSPFLGKHYEKYLVKVEGGNLIKTAPIVITNNQSFIDYEQAFEADIINILVGPLAEAKYISLRDNEIINPRLINFNSIHYYGGLLDMEAINQYMIYFIEQDELKSKKIAELFLAAYYFVSDKSNWLAITALANHILTCNESIIEYTTISNILEHSIMS